MTYTGVFVVSASLLLAACEHDCSIGPKNGMKDVTYAWSPSNNYDSANRCPAHEYTPRTDAEKAPPR